MDEVLTEGIEGMRYVGLDSSTEGRAVSCALGPWVYVSRPLHACFACFEK